MPEVRTVGVEEEFLIVDRAGRPVPRGEQLVQDAGDDRLEHELHQEQAETSSRPHRDVLALIADLRERRATLAAAAAGRGARIAALGTSPLAVHPTPTPDERYLRMMRGYGVTATEQLSCGCHVHVGVASRAEGVQAINTIQPWLPVLVALAANSPFWHGGDTGYASFRRIVWGQWPSAGPTAPFAGEEAYDATVAALTGSGVLLDTGMVYFDARLSARFPTVEIRVADVCPEPADTGLVASLSRALVESSLASTAPWPTTRVELLRGAAWRAAFSGLSGDLVDPVTGAPSPAASVVERLIERVAPALRRFGELPDVQASIARVLARGTGADLQRAAYARRGRAADVVDDAVRRTTA